MGPLININNRNQLIQMPISQFIRTYILSGTHAPRPQLSAILGWHTCILEHAKRSSKVIVLRKSGEDDSLMAVRGRIYADPLTGKQIVRSDNSPCIWIYNRAYHQDLPSIPEFSQLLEKRAFAMADRFSKAETMLNSRGELDWKNYLRQNYQAYDLLWASNWKLCHLLPCAARGSKGGDLFLRKLMEIDRSRALDVSFIRNISLLNLVPGPSPNYYEATINGVKPYRNDLGEEKIFIEWTIYLLVSEVYASHRECASAMTDFLRECGGIHSIRKPDQDPIVKICRKHRESSSDLLKLTVAGQISNAVDEDRADFEVLDEAMISVLNTNKFGDPNPKPGDLVVLVYPKGKEKKFPNIWEGDCLKVLVTHLAVINQIKSAQDRGHPRIFFQTTSGGSRNIPRMLLGSALVKGIELGNEEYLVYLADWKPVDNSEPCGRSFGSSWYVVEAVKHRKIS